MGVTRIGELLRLPRAGLARRLGAATIQDLDIALARQFAPRRAFAARERFRERCDFETEIENVAYLEKALEPLIARCAQFLRERQAGVQALQLKLRHRAGPPTRVHLGLASITSERRRLTDVLAQKLDAARARGAGPGHGAHLRFLAAVSGRLARCVRWIWRRGWARHAFRNWWSVCALGSAKTRCMGSLQSRNIAPKRPGGASANCALASALRGGADDRSGNAAARLAAGRTVWLLVWKCQLLKALILEQGPERIESGWWDGKDVARDYYIARLAPDSRRSHGAKLWVFQERRSKRWYLHGMFA